VIFKITVFCNPVMMKNALFLICLLATACAVRRQAQAPSVDSGFVTVNGAKLYYTAIGKGTPLLVLHGGPGMDHNYFLTLVDLTKK
jgi:proline iminopeptidase